MTDVSGKEVKVGDKVAFCRPSYKSLVVGTVEKITPKGISVMFTPHDSTSQKPEKLSRLSSQFSKID